jgi:protein-tyrosine phosphatase
LKLWPFGKSTASAPPERSVLMVCMGNICRSPTAEAVLRRKLIQAGLGDRVAVDSAGTYGGHAGDPPDPRAQRHAARRDVDLSRLRARKITPEDFHRFGLILAMDQDNLDALARVRPTGAPAPRLLMQFARRSGGAVEVPDPYYGGLEGFEHVLDLIEDACDGVVDHLKSQLAGNFRR